MVPYSLSHFLPFFPSHFHIHAHTFTDYTCTHTHTDTTRAVAYMYKHRQRHTFTCVHEHTPSLSAPAWLYLPQSVSQCWILLIQTAVTAASALGASPDRHHAKPRRHYAVCVSAGVGCVHMCLSMHQWFRLIHCMLYSTKMHAVTAFSKGRQGGLVVREMVP